MNVLSCEDGLLTLPFPSDDFKRISEGKDKGAYFHELFLYGRPALTTQMRRTKIKGNVPWTGYQQDIDFYKMPPVKPQPKQQKAATTTSSPKGSIAISG